MKNLRPIGLPKSIFFENIFAKTYDSTKLEEDQERIEQFYRDNGYFQARVTDHTVDIVDVGGGKFKLPLIHPNRPGKNANLGITIEEGRLYRLNTINFVGVKLFRTPETLMRPAFSRCNRAKYSRRPNCAKASRNCANCTDSSAISISSLNLILSRCRAPTRIDLTSTSTKASTFVRRIDFSVILPPAIR